MSWRRKSKSSAPNSATAGNADYVLFKPAPPSYSRDASAYFVLLQRVAAALDMPVDPAPSETYGSRVERAVGEHLWEFSDWTSVSAAQFHKIAEAQEVLLEAAVHCPDPSFVRVFVEPTIGAIGRRPVRARLLAFLQTGTNQERAGAARAWYWSGGPPLIAVVSARDKGINLYRAVDRDQDVVEEWQRTLLQEFVENDDLEVRRCLVPYLRFNELKYPPELRDLALRAIAVAATHPDEYIRHRFDVQR